MSTTHCRHGELLIFDPVFKLFLDVSIELEEVKAWRRGFVLVNCTNRQSLILRICRRIVAAITLQVLGSGPILCQLWSPESHGVPPNLSSPVPLQYQVQQAAGSEDTWWPGRFPGPSDLWALGTCGIQILDVLRS